MIFARDNFGKKEFPKIGKAYVTGYWKTDHNVTQTKVHFIIPASSPTYALPMHSVFARLSWLVCFSRRLFADPVKSRLNQWCQ